MPEDTYEVVWENINSLRLDLGLSWKDLGYAIGDAGIGNRQGKNITIKKLTVIADTLGVSLAKLVANPWESTLPIKRNAYIHVEKLKDGSIIVHESFRKQKDATDRMVSSGFIKDDRGSGMDFLDPLTWSIHSIHPIQL